MVSIPSLWLSIVLSAVLAFLASSIIHMLLTRWHADDYRKMANEDDVIAAMRKAGVTHGDYLFPHCTAEMRNDPAMQEKWKRGPAGKLTVMPPGPPSMGKSLGLWFVYLLAVAVFTAYVSGRALAPGSEYLQVFRVAGTVAFLAYAGSQAQESIWWGRGWGTTLRNVIDGLVYALLTAGAFAGFWPQA